MQEYVLDCSDCERAGTAECRDCVVGFIVDRPEGAIVFNASEERALRALARKGLLPEARFKRRAV